MKAIKIVEKGKAELQEVEKPKLRDDYVGIEKLQTSRRTC